MLVMPGTPGFCNVSFGYEKQFPGLITVSRPGYGRTPLTEELKKSTAQADLIMALMDHLNIEKLPVLAASGAGVIGIRMAIQYPDRIQALCLCCATTGSYDHPQWDMFNNETGKIFMESPTLSYYLCKLVPKYMSSAIVEERMTANKIKPGIIS